MLHMQPCCETLTLRQAWLNLCDSRMTLAGSTRCTECMLERERERERRERKKERKKEQGRGEPTRGERKKEETTSKKASAKPDLPRRCEMVLATGAQKREKETPGRPQERKGEEEGGGERERTPKQRPQSPENGKKRELPGSDK